MFTAPLALKSVYKHLRSHLSFIGQLRQVIRWAKHEYKNTGFSIHVSTADFRTTLTFGISKNEIPNLIFCTPSHFRQELYPSVSFVCIFNSFEIEVWENRDVYTTSPVRHGLSDEEKNIAINTARSAALCFIEKKCSKPAFVPTSSAIEERFHEVTTVGVAIWVNGTLRASIIETGHTLEKGLRRAGRRLCTSTRSKPLTKDEILSGTIEITVFNSLTLELTPAAREADVIIPTHGYKAMAYNKTGWYIPEAFNVPTPPSQNLTIFLQQLAYRKLGINEDQYKDVRFYTFLVQVFIESKEASPITMEGPVPKCNTAFCTPETLVEASLDFGHELANQLLSLQEADGNIIPLFNPTTNTREDINWVTLSCTTWALAEFGRVTPTAAYLEAAQLAVEYIGTHIYTRELSQSPKISTLIYFIHAQRVLGQDYMKALLALEAELKKPLTYEPILFANIGSLLALLHTSHPHFIELSKEYAGRVYTDFIKQRSDKAPFSLARYPELIQTLLHLYNATQDQLFRDRSKEIAHWYLSQQLSSGAFPATIQSPLHPYTRGTGKIFEVLSLFYPEHKASLARTLLWINHLQYNDKSLHCVSPHLYRQTKGGLRASVLDTTITIDASAHTLLGIARLVKKTA